MWKKLSHNPFALSILSGCTVFLAFECFSIVPLILLFPVFFNQLTRCCRGFWQAFRWGFFTSFIVMLGGFYWVVYVLHEFGYLPWPVAALLYLGFCGFGALNFPLFCGLATVIQNRIPKKNEIVWATLALPALFSVIEFFIPKLFPWYVGHCLYRWVTLIQISEITGSLVLSFGLYSLGGAIGYLLFQRSKKLKVLVFPTFLWIGVAIFGIYRVETYHPPTRSLRVSLIQPNIGSLEKVEAEKGFSSRVESVLHRYQTLTAKALQEKKSDLVLWPETAMPFQMDAPAAYQTLIKRFILDQNTAFIIGGYQRGIRDPLKDHNSAFLYEPDNGTLRVASYQKQILLAFGEYLPFGEWFPTLYKWFPQVADFEKGTTQKPFLLKDGTRLGITICYEAIVPRFFHRTVREGVHAVVNLTNDSWFGPTSEPFLHGSLTIFRAVESRVPLLRATNTGLSFVVDFLGNIMARTGRFTNETLTLDVALPNEIPITFYIRYGDWFVGLCVLAFLLNLILEARRVTLSD